MDIDGDPRPSARTALERARIVSNALADAARRARFSTRSRRSLQGGGFQARRGARLFRIAGVVSFIALVAAPALAALVYFGLVASDQYVSEAQFTVIARSVPKADTIGSATGLPALAIMQDTEIVSNYIHSRAAVDKLDAKVGLRKIYSEAGAGGVARVDAPAPGGARGRCWEKMSSVAVKMPSGIVEVKIRAFTPQHALTLGNAVVELSEQLINDMNQKMYDDSVRSAEQELQRSGRRLRDARVALETARNQEGVLDAGRSAQALETLMTETRAAMMTLQQNYNASLRTLSEQAPQMKALKARIDAMQGQIADIEGKLTNVRGVGAQGAALSASFAKLAELELEQQIAEKLYAGSASALETARLMAEARMMYLNTFVRPMLAEEARYPRRALSSAATVLGALALWASLFGFAHFVRDHMA